MWKKIFVILLVLTLSAVGVFGCSQTEPVKITNEQTEPAGTTIQQGKVELSLEELSKYNGENGNPAYVAVDGVIYDVSKSTKWQVGKHCRFTAGKDLTDAIKNESPHGIILLSRLPAVGKIVEK